MDVSLDHSEGSLLSEDALDTEDEALDTGDDLDVNIDELDTPDDSMEFNRHGERHSRKYSKKIYLNKSHASKDAVMNSHYKRDTW